MGTIVRGIYQGRKRIKLKHELSGAEFVTDAPLDNNGEGKSFSPTDLVGSALGSCILTIMANKAEAMGLPDFSAATFQVEKIMSSEGPRRIQQLNIEFHMPSEISERDRKVLEAAGGACPVHRSLSKEVECNISYIYDLGSDA